LAPRQKLAWWVAVGRMSGLELCTAAWPNLVLYSTAFPPTPVVLLAVVALVRLLLALVSALRSSLRMRRLPCT
jgi:hypothetical protein